MPNENTLRIAAIKWWLARRPEGWGLEKHLQNPKVNCVSNIESELACEIARSIQEEMLNAKKKRHIKESRR